MLILRNLCAALGESAKAEKDDSMTCEPQGADRES